MVLLVPIKMFFFALLYIVSCSMSHAELQHTDSNNDKPIAEGDSSTKSSAYMSWLINVVPIVRQCINHGV